MATEKKMSQSRRKRRVQTKLNERSNDEDVQREILLKEIQDRDMVEWRKQQVQEAKEKKEAEYERRLLATKLAEHESERNARREKRLNDWVSFFDGNGFDQIPIEWYWKHSHIFLGIPVMWGSGKQSKTNYIYSSPEYPNGDNTLTTTEGSYQDFDKGSLRSKGTHLASDFCYEGVKFVPGHKIVNGQVTRLKSL